MKPVFLCAHGAGGHKDDRSMVALAACLESIGVEVVRFDFPYVEKGSKRPDPMPVLVECIRKKAGPLENPFLGGRSMGGRAASMLAAEGFPCAGLLLVAYPLHPAGKPEKLRDAHLARIPVPVLCFNGTRDPLCDRVLMGKAVAGLPRWTQHWLEGADHSFRVLKSSGRSDTDVMKEVAGATARWLKLRA